MGARFPAATYRLQFNQEFRFADAQALVPYLHALGVSDIYTSPLLQARRGSAHGYDVTDPTRLNPELGGEESFAALAGELQRHDMGLLLDIVPNHMAASTENPWWTDVLRGGPGSPYAAYFDIDWRPARPGLRDRVSLPILGAPYGRLLENGEFVLKLTGDGFRICYYDRYLPLRPESYSAILLHRLDTLTETYGSEHPAARQLAELARTLQGLTVPRTTAFRLAEEKLWRLYNTYPEIKVFINENIRLWNGSQGEPRSFDLLDQMLAEQNYRLAFWRVANQEINYRRFFDVTDLVAMRVEDEHVFELTHALILRLAAAGLVTGLRIDHIDGLHDPWAYLQRLQDRLVPCEPGARVEETPSPGFYLLVEKILSGDEELPGDWPVCGTTGYGFMNTVNGIFVDWRGVAALDEVYTRLSGAGADFDAVVYNRKRRVMEELFAGEMRTLVRDLGRLAEQDRYGHDLTLSQLAEALEEVTASFPVYRTYTRDFTVAARDRSYIEEAVATARQRRPDAGPALEFLRRVLLLEFPEQMPLDRRRDWLRFVMRWQQFTGPIKAKGFEDTALYVYNRLVSLNEVGGDPQTMGVSVAEFHRRNRVRRDRRPFALSATSTHDNKRSEDVRARINVLSEIPGVWMERLNQWRQWNRSRKPVVHGEAVPGANEELLIYQTLVGAWPLREEEEPEFSERLRDYLVKAAREAKVHTSWLEVDAEYEQALGQFVTAILEPAGENQFRQDFLRFQKPIAYYGALNSLAQVLLKATAPGVPDFYQGTELWDFSLVDPDNRRPVDFQTRTALLAALRGRVHEGAALAGELLNHWDDGRIKLYLMYKTLHFRREQRELFTKGEYLALEADGQRHEHVCAFARRLGNNWALVAVPRLSVRLLNPSAESPAIKVPLGGAWGDDLLVLPETAPDRWRNVLTGEELQTVAADVLGMNGRPASGSKTLPLRHVFKDFPMALLAEHPLH